MKVCCITGHRDIAENKLDFVYEQLRATIKRAIANGYTHFISGFAEGADYIFSRIVADLKKEHPKIRLYAAIPYGKRYIQIFYNSEYSMILDACSVVEIISHVYSPECFMKRNQYMIDRSSLVIAVFDGREKGGTYNTIVYAKKLSKQIEIIRL